MFQEANSGLDTELGDGPHESTAEVSCSMGLNLTESVIEAREDTRDTECQTSECEDEEMESSGHTVESYRYWESLNLRLKLHKSSLLF